MKANKHVNEECYLSWIIKKGRARNGGLKIIFLIFNNMNIELHKQLNITDYFDWEYYNNKYCGKHLQYIQILYA